MRYITISSRALTKLTLNQSMPRIGELSAYQYVHVWWLSCEACARIDSIKAMSKRCCPQFSQLGDTVDMCPLRVCRTTAGKAFARSALDTHKGAARFRRASTSWQRYRYESKVTLRTNSAEYAADLLDADTWQWSRVSHPGSKSFFR